MSAQYEEPGEGAYARIVIGKGSKDAVRDLNEYRFPDDLAISFQRKIAEVLWHAFLEMRGRYPRIEASQDDLEALDWEEVIDTAVRVAENPYAFSFRKKDVNPVFKEAVVRRLEKAQSHVAGLLLQLSPVIDPRQDGGAKTHE